MAKTKQLKIGLALGSGGVKGLAHIGVIKVLEENNIPINFIAGSSIGAMIGGFYSAIKDIKQIEEIALNSNRRQMLSLIDPSLRQGLIKGEKIRKFIERYIGETKFQDLKILLSVIATDLKTGEIVSISQGEVASAIRASISFPLVFKPVKWKGRFLADGGLSLPVPVEIVREMGAELIIAVNLDTNYFTNRDDNKTNLSLYKIASNSINLLRYHLASLNVKEADIVVEPKFGVVHWDKFLDGRDIILAGEEAAKKMLPQLEELVRQKNKQGLKKYFVFLRNRD